MSLLSSIQLAGNSLQAAQVGLQVAGQNISNADTPGYIREVVNYSPAPGQRIGGLVEGMGVEVSGISQQVNTFIQQELRNANSGAAGTAVQQQTYQQLEGLMNELGDTGINTDLTNFFSSINNVLNDPSDVSTLNLAVLQGQTLTGDINQLAEQVQQSRQDIDTQVSSSASDINSLVDQIATLNVQIANTTGGSPNNAAVGLTDQQDQALDSLSNLIGIKVQTQPDGEVNVYAGGDYLVFNGETHHVDVTQSTDRGTTVSTLTMADSNAPLALGNGQVAGLVASRDTILGGFLDQLNSFAGTLANEFNKVYASGQGLSGYQTVTSERGVDDPNQPLDDTGLAFTPVNGSFQIQVYNAKTGLTQTSNINVVLNGLDGDSTLQDVANQLNQVSGVAASINSQGQLTIQATGSDQQIAFGQDSSGFLAAMGINTFFSGTNAFDIGVSQDVVNDPSKFAASQGGVGQDTNNAVQLAGFLNTPLASQNGDSISDLHSNLVNEVSQSASVAIANATGASTLQASLVSQNSAVSGVSIDEETINMLEYQKTYEASAKYISVLSGLIDTLVNL
jgi:flagellar hook-associated protein 1 FlgK